MAPHAARLAAGASLIVLCLLIMVPSLPIVAAVQSPATGTATRTAIDVAKLGPQIGEIVPDFSLTDQTGKVWTRQSIMGPRGAMIVFYRSADWWPYCKTQLVELQGRLGEVRNQGLGLVGISYDVPEILAAFSRQRGITFPLLSDADSAVIKAFGLLNPAVEWGLGPDKDDPFVVDQVRTFVSAAGRASENQRGMALPGTFVVDRQGRVTERFFESFYVERPTSESVLLILGSGAQAVNATKTTTGQLDLTTWASDTGVAPGNRFSLVLDVVPHRSMHVYAPGAVNYRVITLNLDPQPFVQLRPLRYPAPETYFFKPLNERVPVFQKPFRLVQEALLEGTAQAQSALQGRASLTISGTVEYQACDDAVCYNPASVRVSWTLSIKALIRERPTVAR